MVSTVEGRGIGGNASIVICIHIYTYCGLRASERLVGREMKRMGVGDLMTVTTNLL